MLRVQVLVREGTSRVKRSNGLRRVKVSADGVGVVSHAGVGMLRELALDTGLTAGMTAALADTYAGNEVRINKLNNQLRDKATKLGLAEVFGLARQAANDDSTVLQQSIISTQFPAAAGQPSRDEWLRQRTIRCAAVRAPIGAAPILV